MKKNSITEKIQTIFRNIGRKEGFYIAIFACLCLILAGTIVYKQIDANKQAQIKEQEEKELALNIPKDDKEANKEIMDNSERVEKTDDKNNTKTEEKKNETVKKDEQTKAVSNNTKLDFVNPVEGKVIKENNQAIISEDGMRADFIGGVTLEVKLGAEVKAAEVGVIESIKHDDVTYGTMLTIKHPNGFKTTYCNLDANLQLKVGDQVTKGQVVAKIGKTAQKLNMNFKCDLFHIKVEQMKDKKYIEVDPMKYFKFNK